MAASASFVAKNNSFHLYNDVTHFIQKVFDVLSTNFVEDIYLGIGYSKLWYWISLCLEKQDGRHSHFYSQNSSFHLYIDVTHFIQKVFEV